MAVAFGVEFAVKVGIDGTVDVFQARGQVVDNADVSQWSVADVVEADRECEFVARLCNGFVDDFCDRQITRFTAIFDTGVVLSGESSLDHLASCVVGVDDDA